MKTALIVTLVLVNIAITGALFYRSQTAERSEIFVDDIDQLAWDGQVLRVDLARGRLTATQTDATPQAEQKVVARLILTPRAALLLHRDLAQLLERRSHGENL